MRYKKLIRAVVLVSVILSTMIFPTPALADTLYENYQVGDNSSAGQYGVFQSGQTFTPGVSHHITEIELKYYRIGTPGEYTVHITTTAAGKPTAEIATGSFNTTDDVTLVVAGEWVLIDLGAGADLTNGIMYAVIVHHATDGGNAGNHCRWRWDSAAGGYGNGTAVSSGDTGASWNISADSDLLFKEYGVVVPTVVAGAVTNTEETTVTLEGNITNLGGAANASERGFDYDIDTGAPYANEETEVGAFATGAYTLGLTGLSKGELYFWRPKAENEAGWGNGAEGATFLTKPDEPSAFTATALGENDIRLDWTKGDGAQKTVIRGKDGSYPTDRADGYLVYNDVGVTVEDNGLIAGHTYYYRAWSYATEGGKEQYSDLYAQDFATTQAPPAVVTIEPTGFGGDYIIGRGRVDAVNDTSIVEVGINYGLTDAYGSSIARPIAMTTGEFAIRIDGLTPGTIWHYQAFAKNQLGVIGTATNDIVCATHGSDTIYEFWNTADDADVDIYNINWFGQTFTTGATVPHTITQVRAKLFRVQTPETLYAYIYRTSAGVPTGLPIAEGTIDGDTFTLNAAGAWYSIELDEEVALATDTMYAMVLSNPAGDAADYVAWRYDNAGGYGPIGSEVTSTDNGITWATVGANDMMFEIWGNPAISVEDAKVYSSYIESGDQLIVFSYKVLPDTEHQDTNPREYFHTQAETDAGVRAQDKLPSWGYLPACLYIAPNEAFTWGINLTINVDGVTGSDYDSNTGSYILTSTDWVGEDLNALDDWVINTANAFTTYYDIPFTTYTEFWKGDEVLNDQGSAVFKIGIPSLITQRPDLFAQSTADAPLPVAYNITPTYQDELTGGFGETAQAAFTDLGNLLGVSGGFMGGAFWFIIMFIGIGLTSTLTGHPTAGFIVAIPLLFVGNFLDVIPMTLTLTLAFISGALAAWTMIASRS